ncbi:MAG: hypothetical protein J6Y54_02720 [Lentisphaeria bacterium]|nr:hypothetical protein [Lentisphaeria bacterium]
MKKFSILTAAMAAAIILVGCGRNVPKDAKPMVDMALREFGVPAKCLEIKDVKKAENEKDSFTAVAVCDINGEKQSGDITVKYKNDKLTVEILGFGHPELMAVKNGTLGIDKSRTVEQALSANLKDLKWETFVNKRNQIVVKASGVWKNSGLSFNRDFSDFTIVKPGKQVEAYFIINRDGSFSFDEGKVISNSKDLGPDGWRQNVVTPDDLKKLRGGFLSVLYH